MKLSIILISLWSALIAAEPLLVVSIMIKNEAKVIAPTLQPYIDGGITDFFVYDTGSTDGTQDQVRAFFAQHPQVTWHLIEEPFVDFSTSRNRGLELTEQLFPNAIFILMPDAEWYCNDVAGLVLFCKTHVYDISPNYWLTIKHAELGNCKLQRLLRMKSHSQFCEVVHEHIDLSTDGFVPDTIYWQWAPAPEGKEKTAARLYRDLELLFREYDKNPRHPHTIIFIAQVYEVLGDEHNARIFYRKYIDLALDNPLGNWIAYYKLGLLTCNLGTDVWPLAMDYYLRAFALNPRRAEPLIRIAEYYNVQGNRELVYLFTRRAVEIPYPKNENYTIENYLYHLTRYDLYGAVAGYFGDYAGGVWAIKEALKADPTNERLQHNLKWYQGRLIN